MKKIILILFFFILSSSSLNAVAGLACTCNGDWFDNGGLGYVGRPYGPFRSAAQPDPTSYDATCSDNGSRIAFEYRSYVSPTSLDGKDYYRDQFVIINDSCVPYPICDANQTLDTSVIPAICIDAVPPDNNTTQPDSNSTNPDGTCKDGYAKDSSDICMPDLDGDNIPDSEDPDIDGDGIPNDSDSTPNGGEASETKECSVNSFNCTVCSCPVGTVPFDGTIFRDANGEVHIGICSSGSFSRYCDGGGETTPSHDCNPGYVPAPDYDSTANCVPENDGRCEHPNYSPMGYPFQKITSTIWECIDTYVLNGGGDNFNCPDGVSVACYYNINQDVNNSTPTPSDTNTSSSSDLNNSTPPDLNNTSFDTTDMENKLDLINDSLGTGGAINNTLAGISKLIDSTSLTNHQDLQNLNGTLITKLDGIKSAIDAKAVTPATDMTPTNQKLDDINTKLDEFDDIPDGINPDEDFNVKYSDSANELTGGLMSYVESYTPIISFNRPSGSCTDVSFDMPIGGRQTINFSNNVDKFQFFAVILYFISIFGAVVIVIMSP